VELCTRIEGHGEVEIYLANQNEDISHVEFVIDAYRGFENILLKKNLLDIPKIASRICGLCHASQAISSCKAIEAVYDVEPSEQSILLRRLLMAGEMIKSHSMHIFFQSLPDLLEIFKIVQKTLDPYDLISYNPQMTSIFYDLIKIGNIIDKIFGGRAIHAINIIPGGIIYFPSRKNATIARKYFQNALSNLDWMIEKFIELFSKFSPPKEFELPNPSLLSLHNKGNYDRYSGILGLKQNAKINSFSEKEYSKIFDKDADLRGINFVGSDKVLVGPFARKEIAENFLTDEISKYASYFDKSWYKNVLFSSYVKLLEMYFESKQALKILENPILENKMSLAPLNSIKKTEGIGVVEAPRGTLMHHYQIDNKGVINKVKLFIATEINLPLINQMITNYAQGLYQKHDVNIVKKEIQKIIRAFDPCISCATH